MEQQKIELVLSQEVVQMLDEQNTSLPEELRKDVVFDGVDLVFGATPRDHCDGSQTKEVVITVLAISAAIALVEPALERLIARLQGQALDPPLLKVKVSAGNVFKIEVEQKATTGSARSVAAKSAPPTKGD